MRSFAKPSGLERLSLEARIVYTAFCVFMLLGYASSAWLYLDDELGASSASARRYYLGDEPAAAPTAEVAPAGPALDLPAELGAKAVAPGPAASLRFAKAPRQVMETFHFHLFSVPVCLLILAHIFMMAGLSTRTKAAVIGIGSVATLVHVCMPPLVRLVSPAFAPLMFPSAALMGLTWLVMTVWPVVEMWRLPSPRTGVR